MSQQRAVYQWMDTVARQIPQVCRSQAKVWAAFSWGVAVARRCSQRGVAEALPTLGKPDTVERRLQRFVANPRLDWRVGAQGLDRLDSAPTSTLPARSYCWWMKPVSKPISRSWSSVWRIGGALCRWRGGVIAKRRGRWAKWP